ncbi:MAG TPA: hypothetical protein VMD02_03575 [Candidatus Omnitrophota bacterium]|nr:hypothetical protein [Candidatus Omnitrophota bacterium]
MSEVSGLGAYGIFPFLSEDLLKQAKYSQIKTRSGKLAYILSLGDKAQKPRIEEGIDGARGALKWIEKFAEEKDKD